MLSLIPDPIKQLIADAVAESLASLVGRTIGDSYGDWLRGLTRKGAQQREIAHAVQRGVARFLKQHRDRDAKLTEVLLANRVFWKSPALQGAIRAAVTRPNSPVNTEAVIERIAEVVPPTIDHARVEQAAGALLSAVTEEIWQLEGAGALRDLYVLSQLQLTNTALVEQLARIEQQLAGQAANPELRSQLRDQIAAQRLLPAPETPPAIIGVRHNLPAPDVDPFVGRARELAWLQERLAASHAARQILILGIGGAGKSSLARAIGHDYASRVAQLLPEARFTAIVWVSAKEVELTRTGTAPAAPDGLIFHTLDDIYAAIAHVLERADLAQAPPEARDRLAQQILAAQRTLLIIDNLESVADPRVGAFLRQLPAPTKALLTSREWIDGPDILRLGGLPSDDALTLLQAETTRRSVALSPLDADQIVMLAGGLPLPLRLSVARLAAGETPAAVRRWLVRAESDLPAYCVASQVELARARNPHCWPLLLAATLCDRDAGADAALLAAAAGCTTDDADDGLAELQRLSLLTRRADRRFERLPFVARYALGAADATLLDAVGARWVAWLRDYATTTAGRLEEQIEQIDAVALEYSNLRLAVDWCREQGQHATIIALVEGIWLYAELTGRFEELRAMAQAALAAAEALDDLRGQALARRWLAWTGRIQGRPMSETLAELEQAEQLAYRVEADAIRADIWYVSADMCYQQGDRAGALALAEQLLALADTTGDPRIRMLAAYRLSKFTLATDGPPAAHQWLDRCAEAAQQLGWRRQLAWVAYRRGVTLIAERNLAAAEAELTHCLAEGQSWGEPRLIAYALQRLAEVYAATGRRALALQTAEDVRARFERLGIARRELAELAERLRREDALLAELLVGGER